MTGVSSRFDPFTETDSLVQRGDIAATGDRIFAFTCSSLTQNNGKRLKKSSCSWSPEKYRDAVIHYTCPVNTYMAGQRSFYDTEKKDRAYQFQCCQLKSHAEKEAGEGGKDGEEGAEEVEDVHQLEKSNKKKKSQ